jgi:hypothetical protein
MPKLGTKMNYVAFPIISPKLGLVQKKVASEFFFQVVQSTSLNCMIMVPKFGITIWNPTLFTLQFQLVLNTKLHQHFFIKLLFFAT